ncbi:MAG: acetylxylan esterase [Melioribacteraceae bacterium]|nr:acetylxylan esterase [Melioribacteraceae bacterium]
MKKQLFLQKIFFVFLFVSISYAQPRVEFVEVLVAPHHVDWQYKTGENVTFNIQVLQAGNPIENVKLKYEIRHEKMEILKSDEMVLKSGKISVDGGTMNRPGFLRCKAIVWVNDKMYSGIGTAGFDVEKIEPTTTLPADFNQFWENAKHEASKIPLDIRMTLLPEQSTETVNVYHISFQNYKKDSRIYGMLARPKTDGKYPAVLKVPGAGVRSYKALISMAEKGIVTLTIGIHGIPVNMERRVYDNLRKAGLDHYWFYNLDDRDRYYYKRVYLGCVRAIDFIFSLPEFDGENLAVTGASQGGALSIVTAALDSRVKWLGSVYPALSDLTGYLNNRAGGWPHMFNKANADFNNKKEKIETSKYYDVVNFAKQLKIPGFYTWGFNDTTCPPTSMYSAYNSITAPKELFLALDTGHWTYPEQREKMEDWLVKKLLGN